MNKKLVLFLSIIVIIISYILNVDRMIKNNLSTLQDNISNSYLETLLYISSGFNKYFNQLTYIEQLKKSSQENQSYKVLYESTKAQLHEIKNLKEVDIISKKDFKDTKILSYKNFSDNSIVVIKHEELENQQIKGLITKDGFSAGIVLNKDNQTLAYLNENKKCNYAVFIGKSKAPGITSGKLKNGQMIINYIPLWKKINIDDEVITSGMDEIFPYGIKVGKVTKIEYEENTKTAYISSYGKTLGQRYFSIYTKQKSK